MSTAERSIAIPGPQGPMLGIVSLPAAGMPARRTAVVIVVGGAQYRVGSHRQFVLLARHVAAAGYPVLRFDLPGMGDSPGAFTPFEDTTPHIAAALDALQAECPGVNRVVLWGLCDGASASLLYVQATADPRVAGLALLNPWVRSEASLAKARVKHYYRQRLQEPAFWRKLLGGGVGREALRGLQHNLQKMLRPVIMTQSFQERMAEGWHRFPGPILLLLSERDLTAQEFSDHASTDKRWAHALSRQGLSRHQLKGADHTCSNPGSSRQVEALMVDWLGESNT